MRIDEERFSNVTVAVLLAAFWLLTVLSVSMAQSAPLGSQEQATIERAFDVGAGGTLEVDVSFGSLELTTSSANRVEVSEIDDNARNRWRDDYRGTPLNVGFEISVPRGYDVDLETSGGSISVEDLDGEARAETSGGSLTFGNIGGPQLRLRASGGSVRIREN